MSKNPSSRRHFLKGGVALAGLAAGGAFIERVQSQDASPAPQNKLHAFGERSRYETSVRTGSNGFFPVGPPPGVGANYGFMTPLQDSLGFITPAPLHFSIQHGHEPPDIDPSKHRLMIHGMVDRPLTFTLDELKRLPSVTRVHFVECNGNSAAAKGALRNSPEATVQETHGYTSCSVWTGVSLALLLKEAGAQKSATWIVAEGSEQGQHTKSIPMNKATEDVMVAYGQNGEAIRPYQGYPLRLLVPGWEGINSVKWLRRIKVTDQPHMGMLESTKYPSLRMDGKARWFQFAMGPKSVITRPSGGQKLNGAGFHEISGLAWSGGGAIKRVEVSTDGGRTWKDARLESPSYPKAHTRFGLDWTWNGEETTILSRCTDDQGEVQPTVAEIAKIWDVTPDYFQTSTNSAGHFNAIQPWRIGPDGSVRNAIYS